MKTNRRTLRNIILFCFVAIICGWGGVGIDMLLGESSNMESLGALIFISSPILCMILLRLFGGDGWKDLPLKPNFKQNTRWYLFAIAVYPVVIGITLSISKLFGWIELTKNEWLVYLVVALVWQIWHLPYYLILLDDAYLATFFPYGDALFIITSFMVIGVWTIMYTEIFFLSRSLLPVILMHTMEDSLNPLISEGFAIVSPDKVLLVSPSFGLIPLLIYLGTGLYLRRMRKDKEHLNSRQTNHKTKTLAI